MFAPECLVFIVLSSVISEVGFQGASPNHVIITLSKGFHPFLSCGNLLRGTKISEVLVFIVLSSVISEVGFQAADPQLVFTMLSKGVQGFLR